MLIWRVTSFADSSKRREKRPQLCDRFFLSPYSFFDQAEVDECLFDRGFLLRRKLRGVRSVGTLLARASGLGEPASVLGPGDGEGGDVEAVVPPDPCLDFRVGGALGLETRFALIVVDVDYEGEDVAAYGHACFREGVRIPLVCVVTTKSLFSESVAAQPF